MNSAYFQGKIDEFNSIISLISSVLGQFDECINISNKLLEYNVDNLTINNKPIVDNSSDGDSMTIMDMSNELGNDVSLLNEIISECNDLVIKYTALRNEALKFELEQLEQLK